MRHTASTLHREASLPQLVMAALEAAIQPIHATSRWRLDWMAGSSPAMTNGMMRLDPKKEIAR